MRAPAHRLPALAAASAIALTCAACSSSPASSTASGSPGGAAAAFPLTLAAANGAVHLQTRPTAIISLSPTATEMLYAIGAGGQVRAVDSNSDYPAQAPHTKLSAYTPNVEAIAGYKPDLVIMTSDSVGVARQLTALSIPVLELPAAATLSDVYKQITELGAATGHASQAAREDSTLRAQVDSIVAAVPSHARALTYYYELDQTYYSVTSDTFIGKLLGLLGMKSIADAATGAAAAGGYPQLSSEYIVKANPDYIILADTLCCQQTSATVAARPGWSGLTAVKDHHVVLLSDDIASRWGPRITVLLQDVAAGLKSGTR